MIPAAINNEKTQIATLTPSELDEDIRMIMTMKQSVLSEHYFHKAIQRHAWSPIEFFFRS